jgi:hypothetical protein
VTPLRYWSDQITNEKILALCRQYQPEQVLLKPEQMNDEWRDFLARYTLAYQDKNCMLYVRG